LRQNAGVKAGGKLKKMHAVSERKGAAATIGVAALLIAISAAASYWCLARGYVLYYGDAEAHLNIARRILDSRTPGAEQIGTVWLPLPHLLMVPLAMRDRLWRNGVAGMLPSAAAFILAGTFLFAAAQRAYASGCAALAAALLFALNPNMLYLQSTPMNEPLFAASLAALLWATLWFRDSQSAPVNSTTAPLRSRLRIGASEPRALASGLWDGTLAVLAAAAASNAGSLTRYEGWFLIPFVSLYILFIARNKWLALLFAVLASLGPLAWLAHNRFYYSNALEFYNGPYSAMAIQRTNYPGYRDWSAAVHYYSAAARMVAGWPLLAISLAGGLMVLWKRIWWPLVLLALPPAFYVWSMHSAHVPIKVPYLWPGGWYNTRYGLAILPLAAFAGGALVLLLPSRFRPAAAIALAVLPFAAWAASGAPAVTWKESEVNSIGRRLWTQDAARFLAAHYKPGSGILFSFGDMAGVLREAGIPLREGLYDGNGLAWNAAMMRPDLFLHEEWALTSAGDEVSIILRRANRQGPHYQLRRRFIVEGEPAVEIYQRQ
jgi:hypothetical protein